MQPPIGTLINICNYTKQDIKTVLVNYNIKFVKKYKMLFETYLNTVNPFQEHL